MIQFTIRDLLWLTVAAGLVAGWWLDRSAISWRYSQSVQTAERLRDRLDRVDPGWRTADPALLPERFDERAAPVGGYVAATMIVGIAVAIVVLVWQGRIHPSILQWRRRL